MYDEDDQRVLSALKRRKQTKSLLNKRNLDASEIMELEEWFLSD